MASTLRTQPLRLPGGAATGQLVLAGGGFMPARLLLAPVGARLPPGVHAVAAVPATAVVAPVGRAIHLLPRAALPGAGGEPVADDGEGVVSFYDFMLTQGFDALYVLDEALLPAAKVDPELFTKFTAVRTAFNRAVALAGEGHDDKMHCALWVLRGSYGMLDLAQAAYPSAGLPPLPGEQVFVSKCLGLAADDHSPVILGQPVAPLLAPLGAKLLAHADAGLIRSLYFAVAISKGAARTARASVVSGEDI